MHKDTFLTTIPEPNHHVALNNARLEVEQERAGIEAEEKARKHSLRQAQETRLGVLAALEDKERIDQLEALGATWCLPFIEDGPLAFNRETIDETLRHRA